MNGPGDHILPWPGTLPLTLHLTPERAVYWPAENTLFVADIHLGKAAVFRARGLPVPRGTTTGTLRRLSQVLVRTKADRLVVLGDFLHARESHAHGTLAALHAWRERHPHLLCTIVQGNHDRHAGPLADAMGFTFTERPYVRPGLIGVHEPHEAPSGNGVPRHEGPLILTGHEHPVVSLRGRLDSLRLPCYVLRDGVLTLPAFGSFTGGHETTREGARIFIVSEAVLPLPSL
jgi:DNA ligase-associated metallophosphoesterase